MTQASFLAGLEEVLARIVGLILTLLFFIIYATSRTSITLDWYSLSGHLLVFWFVYEFVSYLLFIMFTFFSKSKEDVVFHTSDEIEPIEPADGNLPPLE